MSDHLANVRPPGWVNPAPAGRYQLVVVGGGPAGLVAAAGAAGVGAKVALVEKHWLGGDCLNVGCVPSKTLLRSATAAAAVRGAGAFGVSAGEPDVDFPAVMNRVRAVRAGLSGADSAERFRSLGVDVFFGPAVFRDAETVVVNGANLRFGRCLVATGTRATIPDISGLAAARVFTNETIFDLEELPKTLLVIGGGPIGCELGQAFARLGARVTLATKAGRVLLKEDADAADLVLAALREDGMTVVADVPPPGGFDAVLVAAGRTPNVGELNLEAARVAFDPVRGVQVDEYLRTTNPRVFAAGDVCTLGYKFTHAADAMARCVVQNALFPTRKNASALVIPWATFTDPEVGRVGLSEADAADKKIPVTVFRVNVAETDRGAADGAAGFAKVLVANGTDTILGASVVGPHAADVVGTIAFMMTNRLGLKTAAGAVFPYPSYGELVKKLADQHARTRLTPLAKGVLGAWLKWMR